MIQIEIPLRKRAYTCENLNDIILYCINMILIFHLVVGGIFINDNSMEKCEIFKYV
jgi:hypothetical protein